MDTTTENSEAKGMTDLGKRIGRIQLVRRPAGKLTIVMIAVAIVLSMAALTLLQLSTRSLKNRTEALQEYGAYLEAENAALLEDIENVDSMAGIIEIAEKELGLVSPDTVFYQPES